MASLRGPLAAAVRASSRRESGLACARGGAGRKAALLWCRGGAPPSLSCGGVRGMSTAPNEKPPKWSWSFVRSKADELHSAVFSAHGVLYIFSITSAGFAIYYVDLAVGQERRSREKFERSAVKGHQAHVEHTIVNIETLKEKMGCFWDRFLSYREDDLQHRDVVTKSADLLKRKGYVILPTAELDKIKSQIADLTASMAELSELKEKLDSLATVQEEQSVDPLKGNNEKEGIEKQTDSGKEKKHEDGGISNGEPPVVSAVKKQTDSGKGKKHGDADISNGAPPVSAVKKTSKSWSWLWW